MKTRFLPVALAAVALMLSACGGSGAPSQPKGPIPRPHCRIQNHDA